MENQTVNSIIGSFDSTPESLIIGKNPVDDKIYMLCEAGGDHTNVALRETHREKRLLGTLIINRETLGGHTFVTVVEGRVCLPNGLEGPSIRYILKTKGTNELPRSGVLDFYPSDDTEDSRLCLSIGELGHPDDFVSYTEAELIRLSVGPGATAVSGNQSEASLQNKKLTPFGEQFVVAKTLVPLLGGAGIEMLFSLQYFWMRLKDSQELIKIPYPHGGPVTPDARSAATSIAARM